VAIADCNLIGQRHSRHNPRQTISNRELLNPKRKNPKKQKIPLWRELGGFFFLFIMLPIFLGLLVWWYFRCFVAAPTGNTAFDIGRFIGGPAGLLLFGWLISWLTKKRDKGDSQG